MMMKNECIFCKIINKEMSSYKVYENEYVYAFLDVNPVSNGHTLVIPKKHFDSLKECDELYITEVAKATKIIAEKIYNTFSPLGVNYLSNEGSIAYQVVFHYHQHIIPKYEYDQGYLLAKNVNKNALTPLEEIAQKILR